MPLPAPEPGRVVAYNYLWRSERDTGRRDARKTRPCAVIVIMRSASDGSLTAVVCAVTHTPPASPDDAVEIPLGVRKAVGLDERPQWIVTSEYNSFRWPGLDLLPVGSGPGEPKDGYGFLPPRLFARVVASLRANVARGGARQTDRG